MSWVGLWSSSEFALIIWIVVCGHVLGVSVVISWVFGHLLGLWSFLGSWSVVMFWVGLWSCLVSLVISWLVVCGRVLGGSVVIS